MIQKNLLILLAALAIGFPARASAQTVMSNVQATAHTQEDAAAMINSARYLYHQHVHTILEMAVSPEFRQHHARLNGGSVQYAFELDPHGRLMRLKVHSTKGSRWGEQTFARIVRSLRFPRVPSEALKQERQEGHEFIEITGDIGWRP